MPSNVAAWMAERHAPPRALASAESSRFAEDYRAAAARALGGDRDPLVELAVHLYRRVRVLEQKAARWKSRALRYRQQNGDRHEVLELRVRITALERELEAARHPNAQRGRRRAAPWSDEDDRYLREHAHEHAKEIAVALDRTSQAVRYRANQLRVSLGAGVRPWTVAEIDLIRELAHLGATRIAAQLDRRTATAVRQIASKAQVALGRNARNGSRSPAT